MISDYIASQLVLEAVMSKAASQVRDDFGAFSIEQLCKWSSIGRSTIYEEIREGRLQVRKVGRRTIVLREDAERWLSSLPVAAAQGLPQHLVGASKYAN